MTRPTWDPAAGTVRQEPEGDWPQAHGRSPRRVCDYVYSCIIGVLDRKSGGSLQIGGGYFAAARSEDESSSLTRLQWLNRNAQTVTACKAASRVSCSPLRWRFAFAAWSHTIGI